jgi:hypothetical protein
MSGPLELIRDERSEGVHSLVERVQLASGALPRSTWNVFLFEFGRSHTLKRLLIWVAVLVAPAGIFALMRTTGGRLPQPVWVSMMFVLITEMIVLLNALLWVAPLVQSELEGKTWLYVVVRPFGRMSLVLGKGLNGLVWTAGAGLISLLLALLVTSRGEITSELVGGNPQTQLELASGLREVVQVGLILGALTVFSSVVYSSLFSAIGCIAPKRAMLVAFSYTLIGEVLISFIPAVVNKLTVQYHLRCLLTDWMNFDIPAEGRQYLFSEWNAGWHVASLVGMAIFWQVVALGVVHFRQYVMSDEA